MRESAEYMTVHIKHHSPWFRHRLDMDGTYIRHFIVFVNGFLLWTSNLATAIPKDSHGRVLINTNGTNLDRDGEMPQTLNLTVDGAIDGGGSEELELTKSSIDINAPVFVICQDGKSVCRQELGNIKDFALYQDAGHKASISVAKETDSNGKSYLRVEGDIMLNDKQYIIEQMEGLQENLDNSSTVSYRLELVPEPAMGFSDYKIPDQPVEYKVPGRYRRQSFGRYGVELLPVIDYKIYYDWNQRSKVVNPQLRDIDVKTKIKRYFAHVVNGMDLRYRGIQVNDFGIYIKLAGYIIADSPDNSPWTSPTGFADELNADTALDRFYDWKRSARGLPAHDHSTLFTGRDLYTLNGNQKMLTVTGYAYLGRVCSDLSVSVVEDKGGFGCLKTATHELGHSLGANHDGDKNLCRTDDQFIMAGSSVPTKQLNKLNPWKFSDCSIRAFRSKLVSLNRFGNCLENTAYTSNAQEWDAFLLNHPGQTYSLDDICKQVLGPRSYMCRDLLKSDSEVCTSLWCHINGTNQCRQYNPPRGTSCGSQRWCIDGSCKVDARAPIKAVSCTFGDQPGPAYQGETCAQIVRTKPRFCYEKFIRRRCCESCSKVYTSIAGCEYGNRQNSCQGWWCDVQNADTPTVRKQCCQTCGVGTPVKKTTPVTLQPILPTKDIGGQGPKSTRKPMPGCLNYRDTCDLEVILRTSKLCYTPEFYKECCHTCQSQREDLPVSDCEYGDRDAQSCSLLKGGNAGAVCQDPRVTNICCKSCSQYQSSSQTSVILSKSMLSVFLAIISLLCCVFR